MNTTRSSVLRPRPNRRPGPSANRSRIALHQTVLALLLGAAVLGCSSSHPVAPARGKVTVDGVPMPSGRVVFAPLAAAGQNKANVGPPATAEIGSDGSFVLGTFGADDGAIVGPHLVTIYAAKGSHEDDAPERAVATASSSRAPAGHLPKFDLVRLVDRKFEVRADQENQFDIVLTGRQIAMFGEIDD